MLIALCDRFHRLPSEVEAEDARLLRLLHIIDRGTAEEAE